ncbi:MAG: diacylglycerol kinase [Patescibacteria group bacterium]|nr:MAG: diacylglycerol kinase [Patescibacteria group bacterium]
MFGFFKSHHPLRHAKSFKYAFQGIFHALMNEPNFRLQIVIVSISILLGFHFKITNTEWGLLVLSMGILLMAEVLNTVVENTVDFFVQGFDEGAKVVKDLSAGFVLITAITTLIILILIFYPYFSILFPV